MILLAHNRREAAHRLLDQAFDFRAQVVKDTYRHRVESLESILPVDTRWCRLLYRSGFHSVADLQNCKYEKLLSLGIPGQVARDILSSVSQYFAFISRVT